MQEGIQVNQIKKEFSHYGLLLYAFTIVFFCQNIFSTITHIFQSHPASLASTSFKIYGIINDFSGLILGISGIVILFFLMLKAIKISSISKESSTDIFSVFSILWFIFYIISDLLTWFIMLEGTNKKIFKNLNMLITFGNILFLIEFISFIFQLIVWTSLRGFFTKRKDLTSITTNKKILYCLIFLIVTLSVVLYTSAYDAVMTENPYYLVYNLGDYPWSWFTAIFVIYNISPSILQIIGYTLLGHRLRKLKKE